jgi:hypothetical protein
MLQLVQVSEARLALSRYSLIVTVFASMQAVLAEFAAHAGLFEAAEGRRGVEDVIAVDPDRARADVVGDGVRLADIAGPDGGGQSVVGAVGALDDIVDAERREGSLDSLRLGGMFGIQHAANHPLMHPDAACQFGIVNLLFPHRNVQGQFRRQPKRNRHQTPTALGR